MGQALVAGPGVRKNTPFGTPCRSNVSSKLPDSSAAITAGTRSVPVRWSAPARILFRRAVASSFGVPASHTTIAATDFMF